MEVYASATTELELLRMSLGPNNDLINTRNCKTVVVSVLIAICIVALAASVRYLLMWLVIISTVGCTVWACRHLRKKTLKFLSVDLSTEDEDLFKTTETAEGLWGEPAHLEQVWKLETSKMVFNTVVLHWADACTNELRETICVLDDEATARSDVARFVSLASFARAQVLESREGRRGATAQATNLSAPTNGSFKSRFSLAKSIGSEGTAHPQRKYVLVLAFVGLCVWAYGVEKQQGDCYYLECVQGD